MVLMMVVMSLPWLYLTAKIVGERPCVAIQRDTK